MNFQAMNARRRNIIVNRLPNNHQPALSTLIMKGYFLDEQTAIVNECFAVIYAPRRQRSRFPQNVVEVFGTEQEAREAANECEKKFAAKVVGPCRSSEGFNVFYLVKWL